MKCPEMNECRFAPQGAAFRRTFALTLICGLLVAPISVWAAPRVGASALNPLSLMPPGADLYLDVNLDRGAALLKQLQATRLGKEFLRLEADPRSNPHLGGAARGIRMLWSMAEGAIHHAAIGFQEGPGEDAPLNWLLVIPSDSPDFPGEVKAISELAAARQGWKWREAIEEGRTIRVASVPHQKEGQDPAYALLPGGLVVSPNEATLRAAIQRWAHRAGAADAFRAIAPLLAGIARDGVTWGFARLDDTPGDAAHERNITATAHPTASPPGGAQEENTVAFSLDATSTRLTLKVIQGLAPAEKKLVAGTLREGAPRLLEAPSMALPRSTLFADLAIPESLARLLSPDLEELQGTSREEILAEIQDAPDRDHLATSIQEGLRSLAEVLTHTGGEIAFDVGPVNPKTGNAATALLVRKRASPALQRGIDGLLDAIRTATGEEWLTGTLQQTPFRVLGLESRTVRPAYLELADFDVLTLNTETLQPMIDLAKGKEVGYSLAATPAFRGVRRDLGGRPLGLVYVDPVQLGLGAEDTPDTAVQYKNAPSPLKALSSHILADLSPSGIGIYPTPAGIEYRLVINYDPNR